MKRLVYYSLALPRSDPRPDLLWQLDASVRSLRLHNRTTPIALFLYGGLPDEVSRHLASLGVTIIPQGDYTARLAPLAPRGWPVLTEYPLLHKFLNFHTITALDPEQVLYLDCDTLLFDDVDRLFARYAEADCYAREEPTCARSPYGYDPSYLDEEALARVAATQGVRTPPPFNLGAVLFNNRVWQRLAPLDARLIDYAWRAVIWMALNPPREAAASYGECPGVEPLRANLSHFVTPHDLAGALPYPSANRWILDQVALWLTLGHVPGFSYGDFSTRDVLQNGEFLARHLQQCDWVLCHYYTQNMGRLDAWIRSYVSSPPSHASSSSSSHASSFSSSSESPRTSFTDPGIPRLPAEGRG